MKLQKKTMKWLALGGLGLAVGWVFMKQSAPAGATEGFSRYFGPASSGGGGRSRETSMVPSYPPRGALPDHLIHFASGSTVDRIYTTFLQEGAEEFIEHRATRPNLRLLVTGHTDSTGSERTNQRVGLSRANAVKRILTRNGVASRDIIVQSAGESSPIAPNDTADGRARNRRVQMIYTTEAA